MRLFENTSPFWINIASIYISTEKKDLCTTMSRLFVLSALAILCASLGGSEGFWVTPPTVEECKSKMSERDLNGTVSSILNNSDFNPGSAFLERMTIQSPKSDTAASKTSY